MPAKKNTNGDATGSDGSAVTLTEAEIKLMSVVLKLSGPGSKPNPNWDTVATEMGLKDNKSSRERFRQVCKKQGWFEAEEAPVTPANRSAKRKASADDSQGDREAEVTPVRKRKVNVEKAVAAAIDDALAEDAELKEEEHVEDDMTGGEI
ncbi:hypothetical protein JX266_002207 [Neoarthrinium moseri]|nr:hypothetical protein JX266_002207 [Neoarthrinium moseri]